MADRNSRDERSFIVKYGEYSQLAFALPAAIVVGWLIGAGLDRWLGTHYLYIVFILLGSAAGLVQIVRFASREKD